MRRRIKRHTSPAAAATRGAYAGLIGGIALIGLDRLVVPWLGGVGRARTWDEGVADTLTRVGVPLSGRQRTPAGIAIGLAYAALLGAGYGLASERLRTSPSARGLLDAALVFAASLVAPEPPESARRPRGGRRMSTRSAVRRVSAVSVFGTATVAAYKALSRQAG